MTSSRKLLQTNITDADILEFALNLEYLEVRLAVAFDSHVLAACDFGPCLWLNDIPQI